MRIYLVRHGETGHNAKKLYMGPNEPLSKEGKKQAQVLADRLKTLPIDLILASPYERTKQTAKIIKDTIKKNLEVEEDLKEIVRPSLFYNKSWHDPEIKEIRKKILENWHNSDFHHSDEENFQELLVRSLRLVSKLETSTKENILLVTHEGIMKMIVATMSFGRDLNSKFFNEIYSFLKVSNTGITIVEKTAESWKLITWNDHAHLG